MAAISRRNLKNDSVLTRNSDQSAQTIFFFFFFHFQRFKKHTKTTWDGSENSSVGEKPGTTTR